MQATTRLRPGRIAGLLAAVMLAAGCSAGAAGQTPTWVPQPQFSANANPDPQLPNPAIPAPSPTAPGGSAAPSSPGGSAAPSSPGRPTPTPSGSSAAPAADPAVLASKLNQPTGLVVLPDGTGLVGERTTGRIFRVQPVAGQPVRLVQTLAGVDGSGDGGLLDLALSPTFDQDGLIYAYLTTATDNRVVHFGIGSAPSTVISGIPRGRTDNAGRIAFDATGALLTGTGDAGRPELAASPTSLAGKVLRTSDIGRPLPDNPDPASRVYAKGLRTVDGLCVDPQRGLRLVVSAGRPDEVNRLVAGADYGWPKAGPGAVSAEATLPAKYAGGGGCALADGQLSVATSTGKTVLSGTAGPVTIGTLTASLVNRYGRLRTIVAAPDGTLWITTRNRDGQGRPVPADDRVLRIQPSSDGGSAVI